MPKWIKQTLIGLLIPFLSAVFYWAGISALAVADERYMLRAESKEAIMSEYREKIYLLRRNGVTQEEQELIDFYNHEIEQLGGDST